MRAPSSFSRLLYFSQFPVVIKDCSEKIPCAEYLCKFRMVPYEEGPLEGLPTVEEQEQPWIDGALEKDNREKDYLRKEIVGRLKTQSRKNPKPHFRLQIRFKKKPVAKNETNFALYWSDVSWENEPWVEYATLTLTAPMDDTAQKQIRCNVSNLPLCFSIEKPPWSSHPSWLMYARKEIYPATRSVV